MTLTRCEFPACDKLSTETRSVQVGTAHAPIYLCDRHTAIADADLRTPKTREFWSWYTGDPTNPRRPWQP
ncbi:hypothetical protein FSW04_01275 [Baekduia soli]|uniref:Uncharacterized protein n=1 Tax=Baekduia soli TaxID=496014 RepID=A0A5B8U037_9ACTN|nr:hypothetical protein [Baekduia soli]QEC46341.1 hypothetical protein FSW04_01275 [Baekduia soli]